MEQCLCLHAIMCHVFIKIPMRLYISQGKHLSSAAKSLTSKLGSNPIQEALTKAFPTLRSSKVGSRLSSKRNKKHCPYIRPAKRECILMKQFSSILPKSMDREQLRIESRIKSLLFTRAFSPGEVQNVVRQGFSHVQCQAFQFLEFRNGLLYIPDKQDYNGVSVIERRGALYLCEVC